MNQKRINMIADVRELTLAESDFFALNKNFRNIMYKKNSQI